MADDRCVYPPKVVKALMRRIERFWDAATDKENPHRAENHANMTKSSPAPTRAELTALMNTAFMATLLEEEGRRTRFTLAFVTPEGASSAGYLVGKFVKAVPFTKAKIAKLAPSTDLEKTSLGVTSDSKNGLVIWGLVHAGNRSADGGRREHSHPLSITGYRAGGLLVDYRSQRVLSLAGGTPQFVTSEQSLAFTHLLGRAIGSGRLAHALQEITERIVLAGHGGTLLVVEPSSKPKGVRMHSEFTFDAPCTILRDAVEREHAHHNRGAPAPGAPSLDRLERQHRHALDHVARLANVDGAVVMSYDLVVRGYGATIETPAMRKGVEIELTDPRKKETKRKKAPKLVGIDDFSGNRHRSAIHFCARQIPKNRKPDGFVVAIVVSQDGAVMAAGVTPRGTISVHRPMPMAVDR
ncbi:MAG: uncharacterized protein JWM74_3226 [Myxococcaceae bacterium]|nr:uncharacterized protein [Myxococcaceae bacterium]